tara:strand:- start:347 stop:1246 length:900 start_codon:yes stop_codon:yes gene_type:complete
MNKKNSILAVGSIAFDFLETSIKKYDNLLGGSATYFSIACSFFHPVSAVGVVGSDFTQSSWDVFKQHNINVENIEIKEGKTFSWGGKYNMDFSERYTIFTELGVFANYKPQINNSLSLNPYVFLGNIQPELQLSVIKQLKSYKMILGDTMNLWINTSKTKLIEVLKYLDVFFLNDEESRLLTGYSDLNDSANRLLEIGPNCIITKCGAEGSIISTPKEHIRVPAYHVKNVVDPTGAGDSFAGGYLGHSIINGFDNPINSVLAGSAVASFTVEGAGINGLQNANIKLINERIKTILNKMN